MPKLQEYKNIPDALTPQQAWQLLSAAARLPLETRPLHDCLHHVLDSDYPAAQNVPSAPRSFMDGFAVHAQDTTNAPVSLTLADEIAMGEMPTATLQRGETFAIPTGGFLPEGADAVVMQEDTQRDGNHITIRRTVSTNENVQFTGEDFKSGELIFKSGHCLRPQDLAVIATFGTTHLQVRRRPRIAIFSTGSELIPYQRSSTDPAKIRETNSLALASAAWTFRFPAQSLRIVPDEAEAQRSALRNALAFADVVLISGGSSVGVRDYTMEVIRSFDAHKIIFHGLAIRPGNPTIFASIGSQWIFGLPGQPVSSLIVFYQFVLPFFFHLSGEVLDFDSFNELHFGTLNATMTKTVKPLKNKTDYLRVKLQMTKNGWEVSPVPGKSASLSTLAFADGFTIIPPDNTEVAAGTIVKVFLFP